MWLYLGFTVFVAAMLAVDLGVVHRRAREVKPREAALWSAGWVALALLFTAGVYWFRGSEAGLEMLTGYVIEKALSVDNLFVIVVLITALAVPAALRHKLLFWGVVGAIAMRAVFIAAGAAILHQLHAAVYLFGGFLLFAGARLLFGKGAAFNPKKSRLLALAHRIIPSVRDYRGGKFFVRDGGRLLATPLLFALIAVEATDVVFALDSIPAVFAVTEDPFLVYSSNVLALLGMRSLYFVLATAVEKLPYLKHGLALVLVFVGAKMMLGGVLPIPIGLSLATIATIIGGSVALSLIATRTIRANLRLANEADAAANGAPRR